MPQPTIAEYKCRLIIFDGWKRKFDPADVAKNVNQTLGNGYIRKAKVKYWYTYFKNHNPNDGPLQSTGLQVSPSNSDSVVLLTDMDYFTGKVVVKNSQFIFFPQYKRDKKNTPSFITIYDLFNGKERKNPMSFDIGLTDLTIFNSHLLAIEYCGDENPTNLHLLRVNYDDLSIEELQTVVVQFSRAKILLDQSDSQKFVVYGKYGSQFINGQIENGQIIMEEVKEIEKVKIQGERLIGDFLQGFTGNDVNSWNFCELDLKTLKREEFESGINLDRNRLSGYCSFISCWSENTFYGFFNLNNSWENTLLSFDLCTLKWTDIGILACSPSNISIDENKVMTLQNGNIRGFKAFYRINLRKPEKLENIAKLVAVRQAKLYGNSKYLNVMNRIPKNSQDFTWKIKKCIGVVLRDK